MCIEDRIARALADANDPNLADFMASDGYPGDTPAYQARHAAPSFPTEPEPASDDALAVERPGVEYPWHDRSWVIAQNRSIDSGEPPFGHDSIFDAPDAATAHAKQTAHALIHEYQTFASQPGHWTAEQSAAWIGQACAVLTELAK